MSDSSQIGENGVCGRQNGNLRCLPQNGKRCCSINGYCGYTDVYCLRTYGCQADCEGDEPDDPDTSDDPPPKSKITGTFSASVSQTSSTTFSTSTIPNSASLTRTGTIVSPTNDIASATASATAVPAQGGLQGGAKIGVIVGATVGGLALIALLAWLILYRKGRGKAKSSGSSSPVEKADPVGFHTGPNVGSNFHVVDM